MHPLAFREGEAAAGDGHGLWSQAPEVDLDAAFGGVVEGIVSEACQVEVGVELAVLLFDELKLPPQGKTKTGFSTDASVLDALAPLHEVPRLLLEYREVAKLKGTYVDPLPGLRDAKTGKIHAGFHQTVDSGSIHPHWAITPATANSRVGRTASREDRRLWSGPRL